MKKTIFGKLLFAAMALLAVTSFTACVDDNDDVGMPYLELELEELPFTVDGGDATFTETTNRPWTATLDEGSEWSSMEPMSGDGTTEVEISIPASTYGRVGKVNFHLANSYAV